MLRIQIRDAHVHVFFNEELNLNLIRLARVLGFEKLYASIYPFDLGDLNPSPEIVLNGNMAVAKFSKAYREIVGIVFINPLNRDDVINAEKFLKEGFRGIGEIYRSVKPRGSVMDPIMELARSFDVPVLIHTAHRLYPRDRPREGTPRDIRLLAKRWPNVKIIMAHISGGGDWEYALEEIRDLPNVYIDLGGSVCDRGVVEKSIGVLGRSRVLFGSDNLLPQALARVEEADISDDDRVAILRENAIKVFGD